LLQSEFPSGVVNVAEGVHFPSLLKPGLSVRFCLEGMTGASSRRDTIKAASAGSSGTTLGEAPCAKAGRDPRKKAPRRASEAVLFMV
jgi:hypothetical protein